VSEQQEKIDHRFIEPNECPRCGGKNTQCLGNDGTMTAMYVCLDCEKKHPDNCGYDIVYSSQISSVNFEAWDETKELSEEHCVYDTEWIVKQEAGKLLEIAKRMLEHHEAGTDSNPPELMWDELRASVARAEGENLC
jgi:hypothetical protein